MKNVSELRIPAYAVVDNRDTARSYLQEYKSANPEYKFKILKLQAEKWVR